MEKFKRSLDNLACYLEKQEFKGYDPYDALNARLPLSRLGKWGAAAVIQLQKRNPINIRPLLGIKKDYNPKAMGLFLHGFSLLYRQEPKNEYKEKMDFFFNWLIENYTRGYSGYCWGYNFPWASPAKYLEPFSPTIVVSGFIARGIIEYYQAVNDPRAIEILKGIADFVLNDLSVTEDESGICFSYSTEAADCCYNASMLGAELLAALYAVTGEKQYLEPAKRAVDFTVTRQHPDGRWNYSIDMKTNAERKQVDFHQGYVLDSLHNFMQHTGLEEQKYTSALEAGAEFYRQEQFFANGRSKWRLPRNWPVDIHHQSQGIITFSRLSSLNPRFPAFARTIADWTIENMQDKTGYFYYRKNRVYTDKISYMRWSNAWMFLALAELLKKKEKR